MGWKVTKVRRIGGEGAQVSEMTSSCCTQIVAAVADEFLCIFVFFPLAIFHWRGTWHLQDVYLFPGRLFLSSWVSLIIGSILGIALPLVHPLIVKYLHSKAGRWKYVIGIRVYLYICGWAILCYWRGLWNLIDIYLTEGWINSLVIYAGCQVLSLIFKTSRTNGGLPISLQIDIDADLDRPDTRYSIKVRK